MSAEPPVSAVVLAAENAQLRALLEAFQAEHARLLALLEGEVADLKAGAATEPAERRTGCWATAAFPARRHARFRGGGIR